jgi:hypothetical protein
MRGTKAALATEAFCPRLLSSVTKSVSSIGEW